MNSKPVFALEGVEADLQSATAQYLTWRSDGKEHVLGGYEETIGRIAWNPDLLPRKFGPIQRAILKRTFYIVYFLQETDRVVGSQSWLASQTLRNSPDPRRTREARVIRGTSGFSSHTSTPSVWATPRKV